MLLHSSSSRYLRFSSFLSRLTKPALLGILCLGAIGVATGAASAADASTDLIARGKYLATAADCAACHTAPNGGKAFAGGYGIASPLGTIFSTNITPSKDGIGDYSEQDFSRAIREGVAKDGSHLYPAMPYTAYAKLSDDDVAALYAYFTHEVKAVDQQPRKTALPFPFSIRASMAAWNLLFLPSTRFVPDAAKSTEWNRGAYLAEGLEHCSTCHTPRNVFMAEDAGKGLSGGSIGSWYAPNITSDAVAGIGGWSRDEIVQYLRSGHVAGKAQAAGPMAEAVENSLQHLTDSDLTAIAVYLKDGRPVSGGETKPRFGFGKASLAETALRGLPGKASSQNGFHVFSGTCATCHQVDGSGNKFYPSLFHNTATGADRPDNLIATILFGLSRTVDGVTTFMPAFGPDAAFANKLSDQDIADVSNYVLTQFGDPAVKVTTADVARVRDGGEKPLIATLGSYTVPAAIVVFLILAALFVTRRPRHQAAA